MTAAIRVEQCVASEFDGVVAGLSSLLLDCVDAGASIGFIAPFSIEDAEAFWCGPVRSGVVNGQRLLFCAWRDETLVGTGQLVRASMPNQAHRAEVSKVMVAPSARRCGVARSVMGAIETAARAQGLSLLTLDTRSGDSAEPLYLSMGYVAAGTIPGFARDVYTDRLDATTYMFKQLHVSP